ncbi:MAG: hypothetical protein HC807_08540 [Gammaproteobacteria bacterium]|nr:hypothetical protein [Gammaproteobacteria bacterium]
MLGWGETLSDAETFVRAQQALVELAPDVRYLVDHLRSANRALLAQFTRRGTRDGGAFENAIVNVAELDDEGRTLSLDTYDVEQADQAFARFREIVAKAAPPPERFANSATRFNERVARAWGARDWDALTALHAPTAHLDDRRRLMQMRLSAEDSAVQLRVLFDVPGSRWTIHPIATRGELLSLSRAVFEGNVDADGGALVIESLIVDEVDEEGLGVAIVNFDRDDLDAAYAELDRRYESRQARVRPCARAFLAAFSRLWKSRDWGGFSRLCATDFECRDHRLLGWGTEMNSAAKFIETQKVLVDLAPDVHFRTDHIRLTDYGFISQQVHFGERDGGAFEIPFILVTEIDESGLIRKHYVYDIEQIDLAFARFEEIRTRVPTASTSRFANAAWRSLDRTVRCFNARDWEGMVATYTPSHRMDDRRKLMRIEVAGEQFFANERLIFEVPGSTFHVQLLATRGERLALCRVMFTAGGEDTGPMEVEMLDLVEVDTAGRRTTLVVFDPDDLDGAYAEVDARYLAGEGAEHSAVTSSGQAYTNAMHRRDWGCNRRARCPWFPSNRPPLARLGNDARRHRDLHSLATGVGRALPRCALSRRPCPQLGPRPDFSVHANGHP